jgi:uncharacterized protein
MSKAIKLIPFVLLLLLAFAGYSAELPKKQSPPKLVNDFAEILSKEEEDLLESKLVAFEDSTSNQIAIVTVKSLDGEPASAFAPRLFIDWGIGHEGRDNGILILLSMSDPREVFINTGYGVESFVTDASAGRIINDHMLPEFKNNRYYKGLDLATDDLIQMLSGSFKGFSEKKSQGGGFPPILVVVIIIIIVILVSKSKGGGSGGRYYRTFGGHLPGSFGGSGSWGGGSFGGGGFGGFGGGSTGGGGAGGRW